jgi:hypothetical protein
LTVTLIKTAFSSGEIAPSVWGRVDADRVRMGASVMRNCFVSYRGPASSRAGTLFVGASMTPASPSSLPPVLIRFQFNIFQSYILEFGVGPRGAYMRVIANGAYVTEAPFAATAATRASPCAVTVPGHNFVNGDWVFGSSFKGMTQLNGRTFIVQNVAGNTFTLANEFGIPVSSLAYGAYTGGGSFARIFTLYNIPYALADLPSLKFVQSADVMTLCCVNQATGAEYPPADLSRLGATNWQYAVTTFATAIAAPAAVTAVPATTIANNGTGVTTNIPAAQYAYVVTALDANGDESVASSVAYTPSDNSSGSVDISITAGSITVTWSAVTGAVRYNIYKAPAAIWNTGPGTANPPQSVPIGSAFGYVGSAVGTQWIDQNVVQDFTTTPPLHENPFARGQILGLSGAIAATGTFIQSTTTATIHSASGSAGVVIPVVSGGTVTGAIIQNGGVNYQPGDFVIFTDTTNGGNGSAFLSIGPESGTYPSVPGYFQSRRAYAATLNNPDTLFLSQTGGYTNMDSANPPIDSDAITMTPFGQQVNTVQWLLPMPGGLITCTGLDAWQIAGTSGAGSPLTPSSESAQPQESNGFSPLVPPIRASFDILYVQEVGYTVRDFQYNFFTNVYSGTDLSVLSNHLFEGYTIQSWAWSRVPWKLVWAVRNDGKLVSLTYDKELQLAGWGRHDTNGLYQRVTVATEPPVDAPYFVVKRYIPGVQQWAYFVERMDNHFWFGPEDPWCVDAGLALPQTAPSATLSAAAAVGPGTITGGYLATGGQGYTDPSGYAVDPAGTGSGFAITFTQSGGVISGFTITSQGANFSPATQVVINDPTGAGATFVPFVSQNVLFTADQPVFGGNQPGDVIRIGGGQAVMSSVVSPSQVLASITVPIVQTMPNDPNNLPVPAPAGAWTITTPVSVITNLDHLEGMQVTGLADGNVIPLTTVVNGTITLPQAASSVKVGLPFVAQLQALHIEEQSQGTIQGKRKKANGVNVRMEKTRGIQVGANQPVAAALDFQQEIPWSNLVDLPEVPNANVPAAALPLFSGDKFQPINDDWQNYNGWEAAPLMIAVQQSLPLPMNITALVPTFEVGDTPG